MATIMQLPPLSALRHILFDTEACVRFLLANGLLDTPAACSRCDSSMRMEGHRWRCRKKACRYSQSIFHGSFFAGTHLKCDEAMLIAYLWLTKATSSTIHLMTRHSEHTIAAFLGYFMQLISGTLNDEDTTIGGKGIIVEIDETKLGKRKYHRGHRVEGIWVVVGVERTTARRVFVESVADRSERTLSDLISRHVLPGSTVYTDCWRGYAGLVRLGLRHETVNHSVGFKDPSTGVHTNTVEGTNSGLKRSVPVRNRNAGSVEGHLVSCIWKRLHASDLWCGLIQALKTTSYLDG
jgi:transposase-like protein